MLQYIPSKVNIYKENKMETVVKVVGIAVVGIAVIVVLGLILSLPVMWLWNACLVAAIPGIKEIGWLQAWGILVLCGLLFKNSSSSSSSSN
jgi:hypothetical protein